MPPARELNPSSSPLAFFGSELREHRTRAGLSQEQLAERLSYSLSLVCAIELAKRTPSRDFAERADQVLDTRGELGRLWPLVRQAAHPAWFRPWVEVEQSARALQTWQPLLVPGLLQTEDYAREVLRREPAATAEQAEEAAAARMTRKAILHRADPPMYGVVLDEWVLYRPVGTAETMRGQVRALLESADLPNVTLQVVPKECPAIAGLTGAFVIARISGDPDLVYVESAGDGYVTDRPPDVEAIARRYDVIRSLALPVNSSLHLLSKVEEET
ncbi:helix-turn-helix transcriptional regulator [Nonomuraea sp. NBC_01738]|uniref:helix-turn-helix domain-containing protein n=1 Tax=Nonomuraea sp. NBC_01738 TaxID=2976003 RepID=UPI002E101418|nr:helix-turn-helix transcriptional regulator [Nonomuraea sp. NBC_01738]